MDTSSISLGLRYLQLRSKPFPLKSLLILYVKSDDTTSRLYRDYHTGFKVLHTWLSPIELPDPANFSEIPRVFNNWELNELADIVGTVPKVIYGILREILDA